MTSFYQSLLVQKKEDLEKELKKLSENVDFGSDIDDLEEETDETEELVNRAGTEVVLKGDLQKIEKALQKIEQGTFGKCEKCGGTIEEEVLHAEPESELCKHCKHG